jgi:hypothetical protein
MLPDNGISGGQAFLPYPIIVIAKGLPPSGDRGIAIHLLVL